jgi:hypothetical protein
VNNDMLAIFCGVALLTLLVPSSNTARGRSTDPLWVAAVGGVLLGVALLAKVYALALGLPLVVGLWSMVRRRGDGWAQLPRIAGTALVGFVGVTGWWLAMNQVRYGDPLGARRAHAYLSEGFGLGLGVPRHYGFSRILFVDVPRRLQQTIFYDSATGRLLLPALWIASLSGLARRAGTRRSGDGLLLLVAFVVSGLIALGALAMQTNSFRVATAYIALPALACLAALGLERLTHRITLRLLPAAVGLAVVVAALQVDVISVYR